MEKLKAIFAVIVFGALVLFNTPRAVTESILKFTTVKSFKGVISIHFVDKESAPVTFIWSFDQSNPQDIKSTLEFLGEKIPFLEEKMPSFESEKIDAFRQVLQRAKIIRRNGFPRLAGLAGWTMRLKLYPEGAASFLNDVRQIFYGAPFDENSFKEVLDVIGEVNRRYEFTLYVRWDGLPQYILMKRLPQPSAIPEIPGAVDSISIRFQKLAL
jgi:hypothetical protein